MTQRPRELDGEDDKPFAVVMHGTDGHDGGASVWFGHWASRPVAGGSVSSKIPIARAQRAVLVGWRVSRDIVQAEAGQTHTVRAPLYKQISKKLGRRVIGFYTSFDDRTIIANPDAEVIEEVIAHTKGPDAITLILSSPGGDGIEAERIVRVCRKRSNNDFRVIVPRMAKSAATMICMGADGIIMSDTAELGPIDPQVPWDTGIGTRLFPVSTLVEVYDSLISDASQAEGNVEPFLQQLQRFNAGEVKQWRRYEELSRDIAVKLLQASQMPSQTPEDIMNNIQCFTHAGVTLDHGRPIFAETATSAGLKVSVEASNSELWKKIWELYSRCTHLQSTSPIAKLCESETYSLTSRG